MRTPVEALDHLRDLAGSGAVDAFCAQHGIGVLVAFGSAVGAVEEAHDLDLAVGWQPDHGHDLVGLVNGLIDLLDCEAIDVLELDRADVVARYQALAHGEPLYESERGAFAEDLVTAAARRADTRWMRERSLEVLAGGS
ncbi:MAG: hypothetical protein ACRDUY_06315 [Nitriliruptorales bacterium]